MKTTFSASLLATLLGLSAACVSCGTTPTPQGNGGDTAAADTATTRYVDSLALSHPEYLPSIALDTIAPAICAPDTLGQPVSLADYAGSYVVVDFWATWCGDCRREAPVFASVYDEWHNRTLQGASVRFLGYSFDRDADRWRNYLRQAGYAWPQVSTLQEQWHDIPVTRDYGIRWIPAFVLISPEGRVVGKAITAEGIRQVLKDAEAKR